MERVATLPNVPFAALPTIAEEIRKFGAMVVFESPSTGYVESISGMVRFQHEGDILSVFLVLDRGHFSRSLLIGGIRQMVYEAVELFLKAPRRRAAGM